MEMMTMDFSVSFRPNDYNIQLDCQKVLRTPLGMSKQRKVFARLELMLETGVFGSRWRWRRRDWEFRIAEFLHIVPRKGQLSARMETKLVYAFNEDGKALSLRDTATLNAVQLATGITQYPNRPDAPQAIFHACERLMAVEKTFRWREPVGMLVKR